MNRIDYIIIISILSCFILIVSNAYADSYHIDNTRVGKELTVIITTSEINNNRFQYTSEYVEVSLNNNTKSCVTNKHGFCAIPFILNSTNYGWNEVIITTKDSSYQEFVFVTERRY